MSSTRWDGPFGSLRSSQGGQDRIAARRLGMITIKAGMSFRFNMITLATT